MAASASTIVTRRRARRFYEHCVLACSLPLSVLNRYIWLIACFWQKKGKLPNPQRLETFTQSQGMFLFPTTNDGNNILKKKHLSPWTCVRPDQIYELRGHRVTCVSSSLCGWTGADLQMCCPQTSDFLAYASAFWCGVPPTIRTSWTSNVLTHLPNSSYCLPGPQGKHTLHTLAACTIFVDLDNSQVFRLFCLYCANSQQQISS